jgi:NAD-dependent DNA ligase
MSNYFARQAASYSNEMKRSLGALVGIAQGVLCDRRLVDEEVHFLNAWLEQNDAIAYQWPGDVIHKRIRGALEDGVITEAERVHLIETLQQLIGGSLEDLATSTHVTELAFDEVSNVTFSGQRFCFTGEFVFGPRDRCAALTEQRGGSVGSVTKNLRYLIVGGLGSPEWKHGSFGTKIEKAVRYRGEGLPVLIVHEDRWASSL